MTKKYIFLQVILLFVIFHYIFNLSAFPIFPNDIIRDYESCPNRFFRTSPTTCRKSCTYTLMTDSRCRIAYVPIISASFSVLKSCSHYVSHWTGSYVHYYSRFKRFYSCRRPWNCVARNRTTDSNTARKHTNEKNEFTDVSRGNLNKIMTAQRPNPRHHNSSIGSVKIETCFVGLRRRQ